MSRLFDLNIETVLEHWGVEHALREIIANALDEQKLTQTDNIEIDYDARKEVCVIRDFGRGLNYAHFTQNENKEKLNADNLIGKFGVGLKDALAVFHRKGLKVKINSPAATITTEEAQKVGFDVTTLHARFDDAQKPEMKGTEFIIEGISKDDLNKAKDFFLIFNDKVKLLETTEFGEVYENKDGEAKIYVNGVQVATEANFLFSYNITNVDTKLKKALNRERSNVGRSAYTDNVKKILGKCTSNDVLEHLMDDLGKIPTGENHDETSWADITAYAIKCLNEKGDAVFMTANERNELSNQQREILEKSGKKLFIVPDKALNKIADDVVTFADVEREYHESFCYEFIDLEKLNKKEKEIFVYADLVRQKIKEWYGKNLPNISVSEKIDVLDDAEGLFNYKDGIIIKRSALRTRERFLAVLMHESAHCVSGYEDNTRDFENVLTDMIGWIFDEYLDSK